VWSGMQFLPMVLVGLPIFIRLAGLSFLKN
jgi:hypothetical protein